jgi:hypothetical protein
VSKLKPVPRVTVLGKHEVGYLRAERDLYPTPSWVTEALAVHLPLAGTHIWEPATGEGHMAEALQAAGAKVYATDIVARRYPLHRTLDFTASDAMQFDGDGICTNPPFGPRGALAVRFAELGLERIGADGFLALLLPNDFDSAKSCRHLFADCAAFSMKVVLTKRIVWFDRPDAAPKENHSWFVWHRPADSGAPIIRYAP